MVIYNIIFLYASFVWGGKCIVIYSSSFYHVILAPISTSEQKAFSLIEGLARAD